MEGELAVIVDLVIFSVDSEVVVVSAKLVVVVIVGVDVVMLVFVEAVSAGPEVDDVGVDLVLLIVGTVVVLAVVNTGCSQCGPVIPGGH